MPSNINSHVVRLHRFLPFSASHDQIYEEYQTGDDNLDLDTVAIHYAAQAIRAGARCVVLTGDAGHGKTHMCRRLIADALLEHDGNTARRYLLDSCDGTVAIPPAAGVESPNLRVHKDLSEMQPPSRAARFLEESGTRIGEALVVCANEGRLRAIISSDDAGEVCRSIGELFRSSFKNGVTTDNNGQVHIINLNYQSIAAPAVHRRGSLLRRVLESWVGDGRRWPEKSCGSCSLASICPIRRNRTLLAEEGAVSDMRLKRLEELLEVAERLGNVVTIREMLMLVAYLITGGLTCADVDQRARRVNFEAGWQHAWAYYNLLFAPPPGIPPDRADKGIPLLAALRRLDPGLIAVRHVDERILNLGNTFGAGQLDLKFMLTTGARKLLVDAAMGIDDFNGNPQNRAERNREEEATRLAVAALRRRAFFDDAQGNESVMQRLGFRHGDVFLKLLNGLLDTPGKVKIKNVIIAGLHAMQGLRIERTETTLYLVDPAFGKSSAMAAIVASQIPGSKVSLTAASMAWAGGNDSRWFLPRSVDWIDRAVILQIDDGRGKRDDLPLDLLSFECVARAASGYVSEDFYANEIRRVRAYLGRLAESGRSSGAEITVFMSGRLQNVSLDMGVIQVGGQ